MSAGNSGTYNDSTEFPDWASFVIVGATDEGDAKSSFSEYGPYIDIVAPGSNIVTTGIDSSGNAGYYYMSGTSFSSPLAAGLGALVFAVDPSFTPDQVESILSSTAVDLGEAGDDDVFGKGRIDAASAIALAFESINTLNEAPLAVATSSATTGTAPLDIQFDGSGSSDDGTIVSYGWNFGDANSAEGMNVSHTYTTAGTYSVVLTVTDNDGVSSSAEPIVITIEEDTSSEVLAPSGLSASANANTVTLNWKDNSINETGFVIERAKRKGRGYVFGPIATTAVNISSYEDVVAETGDYKYRIKAIGETSESSYTAEVLVKVNSIATEPDPEPDPGTLTAPTLSSSVSQKDVALSWSDDCTDGDCSYMIERGDSKVRGNVNFTLLTSVTSKTYTITETSGTYYYRVKAQDINGNMSDYSNEVSARVK